MEFTFFLAGLIALVTTARVITCANPVHALLYLITSMLALAIDFYALHKKIGPRSKSFKALLAACPSEQELEALFTSA